MRRWVTFAILGVALATVAVLVPSPAEGIAVVGHFVDDNGHTFEADIDAIAEVGITKGCNPPANSNYCPSLNVDRGVMAAFIRRALDLPATANDHFIDDNGSTFEGDINSIAEVGITKGCNPPVNNRFCPDDLVSRGAMAAFLTRAFGLPASPTDHFVDDDTSIFEADINAIADAGITMGCNPPSNNRYCPSDPVSRGAMAAFLRRALGLPFITLELPLADHSGITCAKDGESCTIVIDVVAGRTYTVVEGLFQADPPSGSELTQFNSSDTYFDLRLNGQQQTLSDLGVADAGSYLTHMWSDTMTFSTGTHVLIGRWRWDGEVFRTTTATIRATD